jgi:hypothetical protein
VVELIVVVVVVVVVVSKKKNINNLKVNYSHENEFSNYVGKLR